MGIFTFMKLLLDHNLSFKLVAQLADLFPHISHVYTHGLDEVGDVVVWEFARREGYTLVTKDSDFNDLIPLRGFPPKVVWLRIGNCKTREVEALLRLHYKAITDLENDTTTAILILP